FNSRLRPVVQPVAPFEQIKQARDETGGIGKSHRDPAGEMHEEDPVDVPHHPFRGSHEESDVQTGGQERDRQPAGIAAQLLGPGSVGHGHSSMTYSNVRMQTVTKMTSKTIRSRIHNPSSSVIRVPLMIKLVALTAPKTTGTITGKSSSGSMTSRARRFAVRAA